ncbi:hypothetical protein CBS101457_006299 [Exobasidium rhododendri]|nr:hypothetical protein CBS101457_006299 [Exobasidium rhododendri]
MFMRSSPMYASSAASSSLAILSTQPSLPEDRLFDGEDSVSCISEEHYLTKRVSPQSRPQPVRHPLSEARSPSQKRISLELGMGSGSGSGSGLSSSPRSLSSHGNSTSTLTEEYRFPLVSTPVRQIPTRRHSSRIAQTKAALTTSHPVSTLTSGLQTIQGDYFGHDGSASEPAKVPFPSTPSSSAHLALSDSPSARRIARHVSLSGAAGNSVESLKLKNASPRNTSAIPIPPRPVYRHLRYSSDLHASRNQMLAASRSDVSIDEKPGNRMGSEVGSLYANTLGSLTNDDLSTYSSNKLSRDLSQSTAISKHKLVVMEEGKPNVTYQMGNCIGRGQFGSVYRALNLNTGQMVAVKRIKVEGLAEDEVTQLMGEVDLLKSLSHPSVVKYEGLVRGPEVVSIILEFVENGSLSHTLKAFGNFPEKLVASYVVKILEGLNYLHEMKVVHCDLKAANILTTKNGNVKLSDFGVSLNLKAVENIKKDAVGTPNWMAPEVIELKGVSTAADIWSLGCTIIELLTGKPPYGDMLAMSALWRIVEDDCPPFPHNISDPLREFLTLCFKKDPTLRPSAEMLFEHVWLKKAWNGHKELRLQDSLPFLRRISADARKVDARSLHTAIKNRNAQTSTLSEEVILERSISSSPASLTLRPHFIASRAASAPDAWSQSMSIEEGILHDEETASFLTPPFNPLISSPAGISLLDLAVRRGSDVTSANTSFDVLRSPSSPVVVEKERNDIGVFATPEPSFLDLNASDAFGLDDNSVEKCHAFVKITFSKAVVCKICRDAVKKHAVLCEECGLICHANCSKKAMSSCNLRAQLLFFASQGGQFPNRISMDIDRGTSPSAPFPRIGAGSPNLTSSNGGHETPSTSPRLFKMPFTRRQRNSTTVAPKAIEVPFPNITPATPGKETRIPTSPTTPISPITPEVSISSPTSPKRNRRLSLLPYLGRKTFPSPTPVAAMPMSRSLSSSTSIQIDSRPDGSIGYGSSISSASSAGQGGLLMTKTILSSDQHDVGSPLVSSNKKHLHRHSLAVTAEAGTLQFLSPQGEAERKAKRRQSARATSQQNPHEFPYSTSHIPKTSSGLGSSHSEMIMSSSDLTSAKRSRKISIAATKQDCIVM